MDEAVRNRLESRTKTGPECWEFTGCKNDGGYGYIGIKGKNAYAHRVAYELAFGPIPPGKFVLHKCDNPSCVRPDHLFLGTQLENRQDCVRKGRTARGESVNTSKLSEDDVREIRRRAGDGESFRQLGLAYSVTHSTIARIAQRKSWTHIKP